MNQINLQFTGYSVQDQLPQEEFLSVIVRLEDGKLIPAQFQRYGDVGRFDYVVGDDNPYPIKGVTHWFYNNDFITF